MTKVKMSRGGDSAIRNPSTFIIHHSTFNISGRSVVFGSGYTGLGICTLSLVHPPGGRDLRDPLLPKALELVVQASEADSQEFSRPGPVSLDALKRFHDEVPLGIPQAAGPRV